jgi:hypothetical protein
MRVLLDVFGGSYDLVIAFLLHECGSCGWTIMNECLNKTLTIEVILLLFN